MAKKKSKKYTKESLLAEFGYDYYNTESAARRVAEKAVVKINLLIDALTAAKDHLEYCGYGDRWERECARHDNLEGKIDKALKHKDNEPS